MELFYFKVIKEKFGGHLEANCQNLCRGPTKDQRGEGTSVTWRVNKTQVRPIRTGTVERIEQKTGSVTRGRDNKLSPNP